MANMTLAELEEMMKKSREELADDLYSGFNTWEGKTVQRRELVTELSKSWAKQSLLPLLRSCDFTLNGENETWDSYLNANGNYHGAYHPKGRGGAVQCKANIGGVPVTLAFFPAKGTCDCPEAEACRLSDMANYHFRFYRTKTENIDYGLNSCPKDVKDDLGNNPGIVRMFYELEGQLLTAKAIFPKTLIPVKRFSRKTKEQVAELRDKTAFIDDAFTSFKASVQDSLAEQRSDILNLNKRLDELTKSTTAAVGNLMALIKVKK